MNKPMKKINILICIFISIILLLSNVIYAITSSELKNQQNDLDKKIEETNKELDEVHSQMSKELEKINSLNTEISSYQTEIEYLNTEITTKQIAITEQEEKYEEQNKLLEKRLVALYESGTTTYLDMLLASESLSDFISKYYLVELLAEYDQELLEKIENTKKQIEKEKSTLETSKLELENKKKSLSNSINTKKNLVSNLSAEELDLQKQLEEFEKDKREIQSELAKIAAEESSNKKYNYSSPSEYGYIFPVKGCTKGNINKLIYPSYVGHTGVDVNINVKGKSVVAVKDGTVVKSLALKRSNGTYKSYGEYIVINHHDGTMTLYAHMLEGSRKVSKDDKVVQGQVIGTVGNTGKSTGTHLHFEVLIKGSPVNPIPYLP